MTTIRACLVVSLLSYCGTSISLPIVCAQQPPPTHSTADELEFFEKQVRPLLIEHCYECHAAEEQSGGLRVDYAQGLLVGGDSGPAIKAGDAAASRLIQAIRYDDLDLQMPPDGRLAVAEIALLEQWITMGAPDPRQLMPDAVGPSPSGMSIEEGRSFWSFRPLADVSLPSQVDDPWVTTPIDAFVLAELERVGLRPAPLADRRTLIRRVTLDLTGLPPTVDEIEAFVSDEHPAAYERLVDRLLLSPRYGERWGRHWLDVARYADSNGLDENLAFGNAWRYRDYVVDAFNDDKPYDQFVVEQLAGDLLPAASQETKIATGFLALGAKVLAEPDREKLTMDTIDEQIDATGKAFLGLTLGCARCHDHKFDPLLQRDYYALAAIFKSTRTFADSNTGAIKHWYEHSFASPAEREQIKAVEAEISAKNSAAAKFKNQAMEAVRQRAVSQAATYLAACVEFSPNDSFGSVEEIAAEAQLHPRILHHCRHHLAVRPDDGLVAEWQRMVASGAERSAIEQHFQAVFAAASRKEQEQPAAGAETDATPAELLAAAAAALADRSGFLAIPAQSEYAFDQATLAEYYALLEEARLLESSAPDLPAAMGVSDGRVADQIPIHIRGSHRNLGKLVAREFPEVARFASVRPILPKHQSGRLELARWMASSQHPLTARVYVNRLWRWHFGRGIVSSTENFGALGDRPTHPLLLDWLARTLMESSWSTKDLQRLIVLSSAYRMASTHPDETRCREVDAENLLLWKFRMQRLEAEQIRDAMLAVAGQLDLEIGGKTVPLRNRQFVFNHTSVDHTRYDSLRRALYLPVIRNNLYTWFTQFDFPDPTMPSGNRAETVVPPQALLLLNDPLVMDAADALARRTLQAGSQPGPRIAYAYELALGRAPDASESEAALHFLERYAQEVRSADAAAGSDEQPADDSAAWALLCQSLLASNEFVYVR